MLFSVWSQLMFQKIHKIYVYPTSALYVAFIRKHSNTWADFSCWFWNRIKSAHRNKVPLNQANIDQNKQKIWQKQRDHTKMHAVFSTFMALFSLHHQFHFDWTFVIPDNKLIFFLLQHVHLIKWTKENEKKTSRFHILIIILIAAHIFNSFFFILRNYSI